MHGTDATLLSYGNFYFMGPRAERARRRRTSSQEYSHKNAWCHGWRRRQNDEVAAPSCAEQRRLTKISVEAWGWAQYLDRSTDRRTGWTRC